MPPKRPITQRELRSNLRKSLRILPLNDCATAIMGILLLFWRPWPLWLAFAVTVFTLVGDLINVLYCRAKLRKYEAEEDDQRKPVK